MVMQMKLIVVVVVESATDDAISRREAQLLESTFAVFSLRFLCTK